MAIGNDTNAEADLRLLKRAELRDLLRVRWRFVLAIALGTGVAVDIVVALLPSSYTAVIAFAPEEQQQLNPLANVASQLGVQAPTALPQQSPAFYGDLLLTHFVLDRVVRTPLDTLPHATRSEVIATLFGAPSVDDGVEMERSIERLRKRLVVTVNPKTGVVSVTLSLRSRTGVAAVAAALLKNVERYDAEIRRTRAAAERRFMEQRLNDARGELRTAEDAYEVFLSKNRQFRDSPQLLFQSQRLERETAVKQEVYVHITQLYVQARLDEVRDTPVLSIVEPPVMPVMPDFLYLPVWFLFGFVVGAAVAIGVADRERQRDTSPGLVGLATTPGQ